MGVFACYRDYRFPAPYRLGDRFTLRAFVGDLLDNGRPVAGYRVKACPQSLDNDCREPLDEQVSGASGELDFDLPISGDGFRGFFVLEEDTGEDRRRYVVRRGVPFTDYFSDQRAFLPTDRANLADQILASEAGIDTLPPGTAGLYIPSIRDCRILSLQGPVRPTVQPTDGTQVFSLPSNGSGFLQPANVVVLAEPDRPFTLT